LPIPKLEKTIIIYIILYGLKNFLLTTINKEVHMDIKVNSVKFKADKKLDVFIREKLDKLNQHYDGILAGDVMLKVENNNTLDNKVAEVKISVKGNDLFAKKQSKTFEEAVDNATEALKKQLIRYKDRLKKP